VDRFAENMEARGMIETSQELGDLAKALAAAQAEIIAATKDASNPYFKSSYATLSSVWDACRGPLTKHGLSVAQLPINQNGAVGVVTTLLHSSGQWMRSALFAKPEKDTPQAIGSTLTYVRRYALSAVVGVAPEDDDGNEGSGKNDKAQRADKVPAKPSEPMADKQQIQRVHLLKEKLGGWTGKDNDLYKKALAAYKDADGQPVTTSTNLTQSQISNLLKRMEDQFQRQAETVKSMEAAAPIADSMNGEREPGEDDDDGEAPDATLITNIREAAKSHWGKKAGDLAPQWLEMEFNVKRVDELTKWQATKALQMLLSGNVIQ